MPKYDLAGNPLPEPKAEQSAIAPVDIAPPIRYDLAGNPLPTVKSMLPQAPLAPTPLGAPGPGAGAAPPPPARPAGTYADRTALVETEGPNKNLWIGLGVGLTAIIAACVLLVLLAPKHATPPTGFTSFSASDKSFSCDAPTGWVTTAADKSKTEAGSDSTVNGVLFQSNSAQMDITTDSITSLVASDLMKNSGETLSSTESRAPALHKQWKTSVSATHKGFQETLVAGFQGQMGDALLSEWTADGNVFGLGGKVHGYRASLIGGSKTAEVVCSCLESDWPALKPSFLRVIGSVIEGVPAAPGADPSAMGSDTSAPAPSTP